MHKKTQALDEIKAIAGERFKLFLMMFMFTLSTTIGLGLFVFPFAPEIRYAEEIYHGRFLIIVFCIVCFGFVGTTLNFCKLQKIERMLTNALEKQGS